MHQRMTSNEQFMNSPERSKQAPQANHDSLFAAETSVGVCVCLLPVRAKAKSDLAPIPIWLSPSRQNASLKKYFLAGKFKLDSR